MNWKIALTAALLISGGTFTTQAQQKTAVAQAKTSTEAKAFLAKVSEFEKGDATKSAAAFADLKIKMMTGIGAAKHQMGDAQDKGNAAAGDKLRAQLQTRSDAYNRAVQQFNAAPENKAPIMQVLNEYAKTL
ncbi:hypothetical protein [Taibaiella chishuiensis]|uniref:Uncharacterized protein n=1 Tax=Taibaiella chishuiensis TaxID=1434707 RepID=A0A2P8DD10_9BACT|nr:hypothetical protein [Taibaiella chishuiensis]PSK95108.1 hypothetical protein B0I18_1011272 [Taibaiella chishuiensis]